MIVQREQEWRRREHIYPAEGEDLWWDRSAELMAPMVTAGDQFIYQDEPIVDSIMCTGNEMNAQMGLPPDGMMQGPTPGMPPMRHQLGQRAALLGSAPPDVMPQRPPMGGPPPNRFRLPRYRGNMRGRQPGRFLHPGQWATKQP